MELVNHEDGAGARERDWIRLGSSRFARHQAHLLCYSIIKIGPGTREATRSNILAVCRVTIP